LTGRSEGKKPPGRHRRIWRILLKWMVKKWYRCMDSVELAQDRDRWPPVLNAVMKLPKNSIDSIE
jgi:hypothetical protein